MALALEHPMVPTTRRAAMAPSHAGACAADRTSTVYSRVGWSPFRSARSTSTTTATPHSEASRAASGSMAVREDAPPVGHGQVAEAVGAGVLVEAEALERLPAGRGKGVDRHEHGGAPELRVPDQHGLGGRGVGVHGWCPSLRVHGGIMPLPGARDEGVTRRRCRGRLVAVGDEQRHHAGLELAQPRGQLADVDAGVSLSRPACCGCGRARRLGPGTRPGW